VKLKVGKGESLVGFEVPTTVIRRFGGKYSLHIQGRRISLAKTPYSLTLKLEGGGGIPLSPSRKVFFFVFSGLGCFMHQKTELLNTCNFELQLY
jgi:hypothetical protein